MPCNHMQAVTSWFGSEAMHRDASLRSRKNNSSTCFNLQVAPVASWQRTPGIRQTGTRSDFLVGSFRGSSEGLQESQVCEYTATAWLPVQPDSF